MKKEWLVARITAVGTPAGAQGVLFLAYFGVFWAYLGNFCGRAATL